jgi:hypothetical protein
VWVDAAICQKSLDGIANAHPHWIEVAKIVPKGEYYR